MIPNTRITLLQRLRNRQDDKSWSEFAAAYRAYILSVLRQLGARHHDAEDLCQEVLLKAWKSLPDYHYLAGQCKFRTWLCRISKNTLINQFHSRDAREKREQPDLPEDNFVIEAEIVALAEQEWRSTVAAAAWERIKSRFDDKVLQCFQLSSDGVSSADIASRLGLAESSVRVHRMRVSAALCKEIVRLDHYLGEIKAADPSR